MSKKIKHFGQAIKQKLPSRKKGSDAEAENTSAPKITNESVAEYREEVLGKARKLIYPLKHSSQRILRWSVGLVIASVIIFMIGSGLALYKFQSTSSFMYGVSRVIPFPVAWADGRAVSFHSYLFELRHYMHYYQERRDVKFDTSSGKRQLAELKQRSLTQAIDRAYVAKLADERDISVSDQEVENQITIARKQNYLGANRVSLVSALDYFYGWTIDDFKHELRLELLDQKVAAALDGATTADAQEAYKKLVNDADFAKLAKKVSDDKQTKSNGGRYDFTITLAGQNLQPATKRAVYNLEEGQISEIIDTGDSLEIVKVLGIDGDKRQAAHISFEYKDIDSFIQPLKKENPPTVFIGLD